VFGSALQNNNFDDGNDGGAGAGAQGQKVCHFFNTPSGCSRGDTCQYLHIRDNAAGAGQGQQSASQKRQVKQQQQQSEVSFAQFMGAANTNTAGGARARGGALFGGAAAAAGGDDAETRGGASNICKYYMEGRCTKGAACAFSHDLSGLPKNQQRGTKGARSHSLN